MGSSSYGSGTTSVRWFFAICNIVFLVLGTITTSIGIWGLVVGNQGDYDVITGNNTISASAVLLSAGVITLFIAAVGILGAWGMWRPVLVLYTVAVLLIVILELIAAVMAFLYREDITDRLESNMKTAIMDYRVNRTAEDFQEDTNNAVRNVQDVFKCCGINGSTDWCALNEEAVEDNNNVPPGQCTCDFSHADCREFSCNGVMYKAWKDGCIELLEENLKAVMLAIGVVGIVFAVIEILLMVLAITLFCGISRSK